MISLTYLQNRLAYLTRVYYRPVLVFLLAIPSLHIALPLACGDSFRPDNTVIGQFSQADTHNWRPLKFSGLTRYQLADLDNSKVLQADSQNAASGLIYEKKVDLYQTPILNWCWRVEKKLDNQREQQREGDDFAARIYVVVDGGLLPWKTRALNYVWSSRLPPGSLWPNPHAGKAAMMLALRSNEFPSRTWFTETRNVQQDLERAFGEKIRYIDAIAIMTDTDNTGSTALAFYGDIYFSAD